MDLKLRRERDMTGNGMKKVWMIKRVKSKKQERKRERDRMKKRRGSTKKQRTDR